MMRQYNTFLQRYYRISFNHNHTTKNILLPQNNQKTSLSLNSLLKTAAGVLFSNSRELAVSLNPIRIWSIYNLKLVQQYEQRKRLSRKPTPLRPPKPHPRNAHWLKTQFHEQSGLSVEQVQEKHACAGIAHGFLRAAACQWR